MGNSTITGNTSKTVERHLGHSYKTVLEVSKNLKEIKQLGSIAEHVVVTGSNIEAIKTVATNIGDVNNVSDNMEYVKDVAAGIEGLPVVSYIGSEPPAQPVEGATWYCTTDGRTYVWYKDTDSYQWVESSPQSIAKEDVRTPIVARAALERALLLDGYTLVTGSFELGATLTKATDVILQEVTGKVYSWGGSFPATVPTGSTPDSTGGIGSNTWTLRSVPEVLKRIEAEEADTQDWKGFTDELLSQGGITDNGQPDKLGASQRVDAISSIVSKIASTQYSSIADMVAGVPKKIIVGDYCDVGAARFRRTAVDDDIGSFECIGSVYINNVGDLSYAASIVENDGGNTKLLAKEYFITSPINEDTQALDNKLNLTGTEKHSSTLTVVGQTHAVSVRESYSASDLKIKADTVGIGVGFRTSDGKQTQRSKTENVELEGLRYGVWKRYSFNDSYKNIHTKNCIGGIVLADHAYQLDNSNPSPSGAWNSWSDGFFHNVNSFDNVLCEGGEVGVWVVGMACSFDNVTCQGQGTDGTSNSVLPSGVSGTGLWIDSAVHGSKSGQWGNTINNYYSENSKVALRVNDQRMLDINGFFAQGGTSANRAEAALVVDNSTVNIRGFTGQDYFDNVIVAKNKSTVYKSPMESTHAGVPTLVDATSSVKFRGDSDQGKFEYILDKPASINTMVFTLPVDVPFQSVAALHLMIIEDNYLPKAGTALIYNCSSATATQVIWLGGSAPTANYSVSVSNSGVVTVTLLGTTRKYVTVVLDKIGGSNSGTFKTLIGA